MPISRNAAARALRALLLALPLAGGLAGCTHWVEPAVPIEERRLVVLPMGDRLNAAFSSRRGIQVAQLVTENLEKKHEELGDEEAVAVVSFDEMTSVVTKIPEDPKDIPPADIGRRVKADLVLLGTIDQFEPQIPGDIGFARGRAKASVRVIEVARPDRTLHKATISVTYPSDRLGDDSFIPPTEGDPAEVEAALMAQLVDRISKLFYRHEQEKKDRGR